jgi:hypothetical protein
MGMHSYVKGVRPADAKFNKMKAIYDQCVENEVSVPKEVLAFFDGDVPDPAGVVISLSPSKGGPVQEWRDERNDMLEGFEVDITKLPKDVTIIRFVNSY